MSALQELFKRANRTVPEALSDWDEQVDSWCQEYGAKFQPAELSEINLDFAVFLFDHAAERVTLAYALSVEQLMKRDASRMRGFPDVNVSIRKGLEQESFTADKGHFLGHASGGILDINLFPHRRELNRGWSADGKRFRSMERYVAEHPGVFFFHRPVYDDSTWIPHYLTYGVLINDTKWWVGTFRNK
ncbi:MAG: hypothetical protein JSU72_17115 [Deltaproteobacteria bacterium]|nr:MAG: hypothetical protein JSU72_17115 [Deltaproteobacteria bacterium]